jgi:hypothetical protein
MLFDSHSELTGKHAFLSASSYHWVNYDVEKLDAIYRNSQAAQRGTELHHLAHDLIRLGIRLPNEKKSLSQYVNDALLHNMVSEQILFYSDNCFGTADTIAFDNRMLKIHDLKTGLIPGSMHQLEVYAALFCLEYGVRPGDIDIVLRIYQNDEVLESSPTVDVIAHIMSKIVIFDKRIEMLKLEVGHG